MNGSMIHSLGSALCNDILGNPAKPTPYKITNRQSLKRQLKSLSALQTLDASLWRAVQLVPQSLTESKKSDVTEMQSLLAMQ